MTYRGCFANIRDHMLCLQHSEGLPNIAYIKSLFNFLQRKYGHIWLWASKEKQFVCTQETCCSLTVIYSFCLSPAHVIPFVPPTCICTTHMHPHALYMPSLGRARILPPSQCSLSHCSPATSAGKYQKYTRTRALCACRADPCPVQHRWAELGEATKATHGL